MATGDKVYLADKQTLDNVDTNVSSINDKIGESTNTASTSGNTLFSILKGLASSSSSIGASTDSASSTGTTLFALLKQVVTDAGRLTSTRAGYIDRIANSTYGLDKIQGLVATDNTASNTGKLSQKLSYIISNMATSSKALSSDTWTSAKAGYLDASVSSRAPASTALSTAQWTNTRAGYLDKLNSGVTAKFSSSVVLERSLQDSHSFRSFTINVPCLVELIGEANAGSTSLYIKTKQVDSQTDANVSSIAGTIYLGVSSNAHSFNCAHYLLASGTYYAFLHGTNYGYNAYTKLIAIPLV